MKKLIIFTCILLSIIACSGEDLGGEAPVMSKEYINATSRVNLQGDGGETELKVSANCEWTIIKDANWLNVTPTHGSNDQTITLSATRNLSGAERTSTLTIRGGNNLEKKVIVVQANMADSSQTPGSGDNLPPE